MGRLTLGGVTRQQEVTCLAGETQTARSVFLLTSRCLFTPPDMERPDLAKERLMVPTFFTSPAASSKLGLFERHFTRKREQMLSLKAWLAS